MKMASFVRRCGTFPRSHLSVVAGVVAAWLLLAGAAAPARAAACANQACGAVTTVKYNGVAMTSYGSQTNGDVRVELFYMVAPPSGAHNVVVTGTVPTDITATSISFTGVNQTTPLGTLSGAIGSSASPSLTIPAGTVGNPVVDFLGALGATAPTVSGSTQTIRNTNSTSVNQLVSGNSTAYGQTSSTTMGWSITSNDWAYLAVPVLASTALTGIDIESVTAVWRANDALIQWTSGYQPDVVGYYVYRSDGSGPRTRLNDEIIPGSAIGGTGSSFSWVDGTPGWNGPVLYWVQEVREDNSVKWYGPASPVPPGQTVAQAPSGADASVPDGAVTGSFAGGGEGGAGGAGGAGGFAGGGWGGAGVTQPQLVSAPAHASSTSTSGSQGGCTIVTQGRPVQGLRLILALGLIVSTRARRRRWIPLAFFAALLLATGLWEPRRARATGGVSVDATATATGATGLTFSHTMGAGTNGLLVVGVVTPIYCTNEATDGVDCGGCGTTCGVDTTGLSSIQGNLVGLWHFDEGSGTTSADSSGNGNTASLVNSPTWQTGYVNDAIQTNGTSSYIQAPLGSSPFGSLSALTAAAWVYVTAATNGPVFGVTQTPPGGGWNMPLLSVNGTTVYGWIWDQPTKLSTTVTADAWHLLVLTYDGAGKTTLYVDGTSAGSTTNLGAVSAAGTSVYWSTYISGAKPAGVNSYFLGRLDEVRAYNVAMTAAQVTSLYGAKLACSGSTCASCGGTESYCSGTCVQESTDIDNCGGCGNTCNASGGETCIASSCGCASGTDCSSYCVTTTTDPNNCGGCAAPCSVAEPTSVSSGTVGLWHLSEGTGTSTADSSGNGNNGTLSASTMWTTAGYSGDAVSFDGTNYLTAPLGTWFGGNNNLTVSAWVYATSATSGPIFGVAQTLPGTGWDMPFLSISGSTVYGWIWATGGGGTALSATVSLNAWHHLALTYNTSSGEAFYVDGVLSKSQAVTYAPSGVTDYLTTQIQGSRPSGVNSILTGKIDELQAWDRTLSAAEIAMVYNARQTCSASTCGGCTGGESLCSSVCTNESSDSGNCGACGKTCNTSGGEVCSSGTCGCTTGLTDCGTPGSGTCDNLTNDNNNCGMCGKTCGTVTCGSCAQGSLVGQWAFNEGTGTTSADTSGNNSTAHLSSSSDWTTSGWNGTDGLDFTNGTDYVYASLGSASFSANTTLSASAWVYATSTTNGPVFGVSQTTTGTGWDMPFLSIAGSTLSSTVYGWLWDPSSNTPLSASVTNNAWHFLVVTYDPSVATNNENFYVDGALAQSGTITFSNLGSGNTVYFTTKITGAKPAAVTNSVLVGSIDEVSAYSRVLLPGEIQLLYQTNPKQVCSGSACSGCPTGLTSCSGGTICTDLLYDSNNCNACGTVCTSGKTCVNGSCM
jgi:hypothetical protein